MSLSDIDPITVLLWAGVVIGFIVFAAIALMDA